MLLAASVTGVAVAAGSTAWCAGRETFPNLILFQGDSITDARRSRKYTGANEGRDLGNGYVSLVAAGVLLDHPDAAYSIVNRGIQGQRVPDLLDRWSRDCLQLQPSVLSVLIGINDLWLKLRGDASGTVADYRTELTELFTRTAEALPECRLVLCQPFALRIGAVDDRFYPELEQRQAVATEVAAAVGADFVPFQRVFDEALAKAPADYWSLDGIHPTLAGHALMARAWREVVGI